MFARSALQRQVVQTSRATSLRYLKARQISCTPFLNAAQKSAEGSKPTMTQQQQQQPPKSWLTRKIETSPQARKIFMKMTNMLGYGSPKQLAGRRAFVLYEQICAVTPDQDRDFWQKDCSLPPTFQSWFTVTNLHIWLLTVRLRALPAEHARFYHQALIDHFFLDIEDKIRTVLQPPSEPTHPYTAETDFYVNPNAPRNADGKKTKRSRAPDRIVTRQMKIFKEQWMGMGLSLDLGLVTSDMELAGAIWRNILGARGAHGIAYPDSGSSAAKFKRTVNLVGGEVVNVAKVNLEKEETTDDGSGVHDFPPAEIDKYLAYPELMLDLVAYIRRELVRLEKVSDEDIMAGNWEKLKFGRVKQIS